jgi:hypothetical protein
VIIAIPSSEAMALNSAKDVGPLFNICPTRVFTSPNQQTKNKKKTVRRG